MKIFFLCMLLVLGAAPSEAHVIEELWNKYSPKTEVTPVQTPVQSATATPGRQLEKAPEQGEAAFVWPWKYRSSTYELHYGNPSELARSIYGLAVYVHDVRPDTPREKFYTGVLGFHYSTAQICAWLNDAQTQQQELSAEENIFLGMLLQDGVIRLGRQGFISGGSIQHVLGAAPGKKRSFAANLRHERLHVFWDEDAAFRTSQQNIWQNLDEQTRSSARKALKNYAQDNEKQLIEEWAVKNAEQSNMSLQ